MPKKYPSEFKRDVVQLARDRDVSIEQISRDMGVSASSIKRWVAQADIDEGVRDGTTSDDVAELRRLRRDNRRLAQEVEILRRATAYFAKDAAPK